MVVSELKLLTISHVTELEINFTDNHRLTFSIGNSTLPAVSILQEFEHKLEK